jgi:CubicO group peptidase (beta-lactamase class C family)
MRMRIATLLLALLAVALPPKSIAAPISNTRFAATKRLVGDAVDRLGRAKGGLAGYSVIIAAEGHPDFLKTYGIADARTGAPVTSSTAFYIASMTKSYTGLLAARLDREGVLPLSTPLTAIWPDLRLPAPLDPSAITLLQLLSHRSGIANDPLEDRTAYTDEVRASAYPRLIETASQPTGKAFLYSNLGYLIYSAALKERTGRDWKAELAERVLQPLGLTQSYTRASLVPRADLAWGHRWNGSKWLPVPPKEDEIMHAAGGMFVSSRDLARWLRVQIAEGRGVSGLQPADFKLTKMKLADQNEDNFGMKCDGYAIGWALCDFMGERLYFHGGTYDGVRTHLILLPERRAGVAIMANSDSATGGLGFEFLGAIICSITGKDSEAARRVEAMTGRYPERVAKFAARRHAGGLASEAEAVWGGWKWSPDRAALHRYEGVYHSDLWGDVEVRAQNGALIAFQGVMRRTLRPASPALFGTRLDELDPYQPVRFTTSAGAISAMQLNGRSFQRLSGG